ncbi:MULTISPECIES: hypothetical protein [Bacillaceae]|uniref:hypothetical protein n=1 Tax=Bacillaceae TaxID=186817 RepID=UPI000ACFAA45|nr:MULTISPECIES: hypothetical protein [Bacillaceae]UOE95323.1 hypothetical protein MM271_06810 [Alkalihalobacillus sp. LMS39]
MENQQLETNAQHPRTNVEQNSVVSLSDWMITILLMAIPIVNIVMLFVWGFGGGTNPSKANYAKATLIWIGIGIVLYLFIIILTVIFAFSSY